MISGLPLSRLLAAFNKASVYAFMSLTLSRLGAPCTSDYVFFFCTNFGTGRLTLLAIFVAASTALAFTTLPGVA
jgi:hypothetical protein